MSGGSPRGGTGGSPRPAPSVPGSGGESVTLNFSINLANGAGGNVAGPTGDQTVQVSVSLSRNPSTRQMGDTGEMARAEVQAAEEGSGQMVAYEGGGGEEAVWPTTDGAEYGGYAQAASGEESYDPSAYALVAAEQPPPELDGLYGDLGGQESGTADAEPASSSGYDASLYGQEYAADDPYNAEEAGLGQQPAQEEAAAYGAYGEVQQQEEAQQEAGGYRRLKGGLTIATAAGGGNGSAKVLVAPPPALSPTTYDYNKDVWGDMWSYEAQAPNSEAVAELAEAGGAEDSDDDYEEEHLGDDFEESPWVPPSVDKALEYRAKAVFEEASAPVCRGVHLSDLGLGVTLYFRFLRMLIALFALLLLLAVPALSLYSSGTRIPADKRDFLGFYAATLGNMGVQGEDGTWHAVMGGNAVSLASAGSLLGTMDVLSSVAYLLMVVGMTWEVHRRTKKGAALTAKDFAVYVTGFPKDAKKEAIIEHFSSLYPLNDFDWKGRAPVIGRLREPVRDTANSADERYLGKWVSEVTLARRNGRKLRTFLSNDEKTVQLKRIRANMKMYSEGTPLLEGRGASEDKYEKFEKQLNELGAEMETIAERLGKDKALARREKECVGAFLIFEYAESKTRCLQDHSWANVRQWCQYPKPMLFQNRRLTVRTAPDPEDVWWENLEVSMAERFCRRTIANVIMAVFLIVSFAVVIILTGAKQRQTANAPKLSMCAKEVPALFLGGFDNSTTGLSFVTPSPFECPSCDTQCSDFRTNAGYAVYSYKNSALKPAIKYSYDACLTSACPDPTRGVQCPCVVPSGSDDCPTLACIKPALQADGHHCQSFKSRTIAGCYCSYKLDTLVASSGYFSGLVTLLSDGLCSSFATSIGVSMLLQVVLSVSTLGVNMILTFVTQRLTALEHNDSSDTEAAQLITKVFVAMYLNTAILLLLAYGKLGGTGPLSKAVRAVGILAGSYSDFTASWYAEVGVQLTVTSLIAAVSPHLEPLATYFVLQPLSRILAQRAAAAGRPTCVMQADLNQLYVGPRFDVTQRYPQLLNILFFAMTYSTGMPLMLLFALLSFSLSYIVDRFLLLRFYRRPPQRDERLQRKVNRMLPYALLVHLSLSVWMLGSNELFGLDTLSPALQSSVKRGTDASAAAASSSNSALSEKIGRGFTFPLFLFWVLLLAYLVVVDVLPSQSVHSALVGLKTLLKGRMQVAPSSSDAGLLGNGYTKVYERPVPKDFKPEDITNPDGRFAGWATHTYDDGSTVLRRLKGAPGTSKHAGRSPDAATTMKVAMSPSGKALYRRTWEIIKVNALHTYALSRNPKYKQAVELFFKEFGGDKDKQQGAGQQAANEEEAGEDEEEEDEEAAS